MDDMKNMFIELGLTPPSEKDVIHRCWTAIVDGYKNLDRWPVFGILSCDMTDTEYGDVVRHIWTHSEGDFDQGQFDTVFMNHQRSITRDAFMTDSECEYLHQLPDPVKVYRGCQEATREGICWTTDIDCARNFARDRGAVESSTGEGIVLAGECLKVNVIAYFDAKCICESEIVTKQVANIRVIEKITIDDENHST